MIAREPWTTAQPEADCRPRSQMMRSTHPVAVEATGKPSSIWISEGNLGIILVVPIVRYSLGTGVPPIHKPPFQASPVYGAVLPIITLNRSKMQVDQRPRKRLGFVAIETRNFSTKGFL